MQPTVFASYKEAQRAEVVVGALLEAGVAPEDISLLVKEPAGAFQPGQKLAPALEALVMVDAGQSRVPMIGYPDRETFGSDVYEAPVGGGIDTASRNDAVDSIDQADEGQELAEDMIYPDQPYVSFEQNDVDRGAQGFFNTTRPEGRPFSGRREDDAVTSEEDALSALHVPGIGYVLGGGALSTEIIGAGMAAERGGNPAASLAEYLTDQNVPKDEAVNFTIDFGAGGAILAVAAPPGTGIGLERIEQTLNSNGARNTRTVEV